MRGKLSHELSQVQLPLAGETAEMAAPGEHVHLQQRGVRQLYKHNFLGGDFIKAVKIIAARQDMKTIENDPQRRMVYGLNPRPGVAPQVHVTSPCQRFITDSNIILGGQLRQRAQIAHLRGHVFAAVGRDITAEQHARAAQLLHDVELARCA